MSLPNDISRCVGQSQDSTCEKRETCRRYMETVEGIHYSWFLPPQVPGPCGYYLPRREAPGEGLPDPEQSSQSQGNHPTTPTHG